MSAAEVRGARASDRSAVCDLVVGSSGTGLISASRQGRSYSFVPFVGALLGIAACLVAPWRHSAYAIPIFFVLDPTPVMFAFAAIKDRRSK